MNNEIKLLAPAGGMGQLVAEVENGANSIGTRPLMTTEHFIPSKTMKDREKTT